MIDPIRRFTPPFFSKGCVLACLLAGVGNVQQSIAQSAAPPAVQSAVALSKRGIRGEAQITALMQQMTLEEKVRMLSGGAQPGVSQLPGVPRLGIPPIYPSDGPRGMTAAEGTAFPSGIGQAMSWDPALFRAVGQVIGQETRAAGRTMVFAPAMNIERDPLNGRFFEYLTEDPYLNGQLAAPMVQGIQGERVASCLKHLAANNREWNRDWYMSNVDERSLEEIYLPGFKAAVQQGDVWAVMTAANGLNGTLACQNEWLLTKTLKVDWGFKGLALTDYNRARGEKAAFAGLDISMPWSDWDTESMGKPLMNDVIAGKFPLSLIDDKVHRILWVMQNVGLLDGVDPHTGGSVDTPAHQAVALRSAEESLVLLKNEHHTLPLEAATLKRIVVLGPNADRLLCDKGLGGSSGVHPPFEVTALAGLKKRLGEHTVVQYLPIDIGGAFEAIDGRYLKTAEGAPGLDAQYFNDGTAAPVLQRIDPKVDFNWEMRSPDPAIVHTDNFSAMYDATLTPPATGFYTFRLSGQDSATLLLNTQPFLVNQAEGGFHSITAGVQLQAGQAYPIRLRYHANVGDSSLHLDWSLPRTADQLEGEVKAAGPAMRSADAVIFVGGWDHGQDTEGLDRQNMDFPKGQEELIRKIAVFNPRTIVVLEHGSPFTMSGWLGSVPAVLDAWYPGMEGGTAIAEALMGDINTSGRLTFTWPRQLRDSPTYSVGTATKEDVNYKEGVFVGYRYFDTPQQNAHDLTPEFPFGFGLSYAAFKYSDLTISPTGDAVHVSLKIQNTSKRSGADVVQLYVAPPALSVARPAHELRGFERVSLQPGEQRIVSFELNVSSFRHWDTPTHAWMRDDGVYTVQVGSSSRDLPLTSRVTISPSAGDSALRTQLGGASLFPR